MLLSVTHYLREFERRGCFAKLFSLLLACSLVLYVLAFYPFFTTLLCASRLLCLYWSATRSLVRTLVRHFVSTGVPCPLLSDVHLGNDNEQLMNDKRTEDIVEMCTSRV